MALLLLFEKSDSLNYKELHATTKMSDEQFPRYVQSLIDAKLLTSNTEVSPYFYHLDLEIEKYRRKYINSINSFNKPPITMIVSPSFPCLTGIGFRLDHQS